MATVRVRSYDKRKALLLRVSDDRVQGGWRYLGGIAVHIQGNQDNGDVAVRKLDGHLVSARVGVKWPTIIHEAVVNKNGSPGSARSLTVDDCGEVIVYFGNLKLVALG